MSDVPRTDLFGRPKPTEEEKRRALAEPGPTWRHWFYSSFAKMYLGLGLFIVDGIVAAAFLTPPANVPALLGVLALLLYLEVLLWQVLWYVPHPDALRSRTSGASPAGWRRLWRPVEYGRWTEEADARRRGEALGPARSGPDPREFL